MASASAANSTGTELQPPEPTKNDYQGPHNWRKSLKPVKTPVEGTESGDQPCEKVVKDHRMSKEERIEENRIRERLKAMPVWKKDLIPGKSKGPVVAKATALSPSSNSSNVSSTSVSSSHPKRRSNSTSSHAESAFTRQVVNRPTSPGLKRKHSIHSRLNIPAVEKRPSVLVAPGRRAPSPNMPLDSAGDGKRRIEKVMKARLYLLQQNGPNSFLIGGDSPDHKYRVIIGPQRCSCGRAPHCVHILFVMLRVFQLGESDPCLWSKTLKNFEVETLFQKFHLRRSSLIRNLSRRGPKSQPEATKVAAETSEEVLNETSNIHEEDAVEEDGAESKEEEEDTCSICLLEMVEGESLTECANCQNKLHHHCIDVWFRECRRQKEHLICPLCRAQWKVENESSDVASAGEDLPVPPNTRASSPQNVPNDHSQEGDIMLPRAEPLTSDHMEIARPWIQVLGEDLVSCLFSKNWMVRETALKQLGRVAIGSLLLGVGEGRSGVMLSPTRQATTHTMLECCCSVLAHMCADPVYKVFVAGLRTMRTVLAYTPCRDIGQQSRVQTLMKPLVETILWKCADSNKRTSQLSISALQELVKGQEGELAVGKEIHNPGSQGLGGLGYLLECISQASDAATVQWQWLLGRFYMLSKLLEDHPTDFIMQPVNTLEDGYALGESKTDKEAPGRDNINVERFRNYERVSNVLNFTSSALANAHQKVARMARKVFYMVSKLQAHNSVVLKHIMNSLENLDLNLQVHLKRRLLRMAAEYNIAQHVMSSVHNQDEENEEDEGLPPFATPILSACSTPRSDSPTPSPQISVTVNNFISGNINFVPTAPPNSPTRKRTARRRTVSGQDDAESVVSSGPPSAPATSSHSSEPTSRSDPSTPASTDTHHTEINTESLCVTDLPPKVDVCIGTSPTLTIRGIPSGCSDVDHLVLDQSTDDFESQDDNLSCDTEDIQSEITNDLEISRSEVTTNEDADVSHLETTTDLDEIQVEDEEDYNSPSTPDDLSVSSANATAASSSELTEDLSDLTLSPSTAEVKVSFKTEVASGSPQHYNAKKHKSNDEESCHCKEEVEREEAQALALAMDQSETHQATLPYVPGLSRVDSQATLTIHIQPEDGKEENYAGQKYLEDVDWKRGMMLGTGAFSTCYQARDVKTGTLMAVKQISFCRNSLEEQERVVECVEEEIEMMARLNHPNIIRILGATQQGCHFFMFVEWMPGGSVAYLLEQYGAFTELVIVSYIRQVLMGLAYLHDCHMLHRDLKGANLLVDSTGQKIRIGDFGASARLASRQTQHGEFQGQLLGTIAFMAPEVLRGESYGRSCDVWSVGCVMIEMSTRRPPWGANDISNHLALIFKIASCTESPPIPENMSPAVRDLLLRCLECNRDDRPPAKELLKHPLFTMTTSKH